MLELFAYANFIVNIFQLSLHQYLMLNHFFLYRQTWHMLSSLLEVS